MRKIAPFWIASLVGIALVSSGLTYAQAQVPRLTPLDPAVLSGPDIGFRVDSYDREGRAQGRLVVRVNGQWVETSFAGGVRRIH